VRLHNLGRPSSSSFHQVLDPKLRQRRKPTIQYVVSPLNSVGAHLIFTVRSMNVRCCRCGFHFHLPFPYNVYFHRFKAPSQYVIPLLIHPTAYSRLISGFRQLFGTAVSIWPLSLCRLGCPDVLVQFLRKTSIYSWVILPEYIVFPIVIRSLASQQEDRPSSVNRKYHWLSHWTFQICHFIGVHRHYLLQ
jgi:hypothetical protein